LSPTERLALMVPVCQAVQHAHQKGVIHRDIKPSNVLIALYDGVPVPKVIDFGVAKATAQRLTERTMFTEVGQLVGTLEYMAPEQAELNNLDIDTRADVYSLGVLLYELLTGAPPFTGQQLRKASFDEMLRIIREVEPSKPSTKLSSSAELPAIAAKRKLEPRRLAKVVRGELDWIVMKCLAKERNRRYETANGLAADIERYLHDEPVRAGPPGAAYQLRKMARRYKRSLVAGAVFVALLLGGVVASTWQAVRATRAEAQLRVQRDLAQEARQRADRNFALAKEAVDKYLNKVTDNPKLKEANFHQLRKELLETALPFYQQFVQQESQDPDLRSHRGEAYRRLAELRQELGDRETALADHRRGLENLEPLVAEFPAVGAYRLALAKSQGELGLLLFRLGQRDEGEVHHRQALTILERLVADFPNVPEYRAQLADAHSAQCGILFELNRLPEAEKQQRLALAEREKLVADFPTVASYQSAMAESLHNLALILTDAGKRVDAVALYDQAIRYEVRALERDPQNARAQEVLAYHHRNLGEVLSELGRRDEAMDHLRQAVSVAEKLATDFPTVPRYRNWLGICQTSLSDLLASLGQWSEAERLVRQALALREKLAADFPTVVAYQRDLAESLHKLATALRRPAQRTEAVSLLGRALRQERRTLELTPHDEGALQALQEHHFSLGELLTLLCRRTEGQAHLRQALSAGEKQLANVAFDLDRRGVGVWTHSRLGRLLAELGRWDEAEAQCLAALADATKLVSEHPDVQAYGVARAASYTPAADLLRDRGRPQQALNGYGQAVTALEAVLAKEKRLALAREELRDAHAGRARALDRMGRHNEAAQDWARALELDDGQNRPMLQLGQAISQAHHSGEHRQALAQAEALAKDADGPTLEGLARLCALASAANGEPKTPEAAAAREQYPARAVELLRQAVAKGYRDSLYLKNGTDLSPLRGRMDLQKLVREVEAMNESSNP
jgi:tetratricopeptide (TPR) repeat protein